MHRRQFLKRGGLAVAASSLGTFGYAIGFEPHWIEVVERELVLEALPVGLEGARLVQLSDLHVGPRVSDAYVIEAFDRARALAPDIVAITGDFLTHRTDRGAEQFTQLGGVLAHVPRGRLATVGILGNHDYGRNWSEPDVAERVVAEAEQAGVRMLRNERYDVAGLDIIGVDDLWARRSDPAVALGKRQSAATVVLVHNPDAADQATWGNYRGWMLAGHTHGGQCKAPFLPPPLLPVQNRRYVAGAVTVDAQRTLYINRGIGHLVRARFGVRPEITVFTLRSASGASGASVDTVEEAGSR
ncbi:MAG: metallophosphoesterase [Cytophagaceae bacterium]|nr:metallophosphoesterase [Gemmatimonadaceae bacterium]